MIEIFKEFSFDAAHHLDQNVATDHPYARLHGHSFTATVALRGEPDPESRWLVSFEDLQKALSGVQAKLDHRCLNDIKGLEQPTLENICQWIWRELKPLFPQLHRVMVRRGTLGEGCSYFED